MQKLEQVGYSSIEIVDNTDTTLNVTNALTNQTISTVPAKFVEITYNTASAPNETRRGYFILTATDATHPNLGMTKGYSVFYEGTSTAAGAPTAATIQETTAAAATPSSSLAPTPLPVLVRQMFESFELIAAPEVVQGMLAAQSEQPQEVEEPTNPPLTVEITSSDTEEGEAIAPATFEFEADVAGGTEPYTIRWSFGDGGSEESDDDDIADHTFEEAGSYDVGVTVTDSGGQSASDSVEINVEEAPLSPPTIIEPPVEEELPITTEQPLTVQITSSDTEEGEAIAPATFEFEADVAGGTEPYSYSWDFDGEGGGSSSEESTEQSVSHTFEEAGSYDVVLTVTDSAGQSASDSVEISVEEAPEEVVVEEEEPAVDDVDNNSGSDDLFGVDDFLDDLFGRLGIDN